MTQKIPVTNEWTLVSSNALDFSIQNACQWPIYLSHTDSDAEPPSDDKHPIVLKPFEKKYKVDPATIFYGTDTAHIWAKSIGGEASAVMIDLGVIIITTYVTDGYVDTDYVVP